MSNSNQTLPKSFTCIDAHTCGNPVRLVKEGGPILHGKTMSEKRQHFLKEYDWIRTGLMFEPRGHDMMSGSILYPPHDPENDVAVLFIETSGCLPMCGHGTIGTITIGIQEGLITPKIPGIVRMETPAGLVMVEYTLSPILSATAGGVEKIDESKETINSDSFSSRQSAAFPSPLGRIAGAVSSVKLTNVASYLAATELVIESPQLGELIIDVAYGGNFYAIVDEQKNFKGIQHYTASELISFSGILRQRINEKYEFVHPLDDTIKGCSHILWAGETIDKTSTARNAVFYGDKAIDRSPCGTGTSARMAQWYAKGKLKKGDQFIHESIIGSKFTGTIEEETMINNIPAIKPGIEGWAKIYGRNIITIDKDDDPYAYGFQVI